MKSVLQRRELVEHRHENLSISAQCELLTIHRSELYYTYSRYVVRQQWCVNTIEQAILDYGKPEIINFEQGCQFTSELYIDFIKSQNITISVDGKRRAIDNVFIKRFWSSVKYEQCLLVYENENAIMLGTKGIFSILQHRKSPSKSSLPNTKSILYALVA